MTQMHDDEFESDTGNTDWSKLDEKYGAVLSKTKKSHGEHTGQVKKIPKKHERWLKEIEANKTGAEKKREYFLNKKTKLKLKSIAGEITSISTLAKVPIMGENGLLQRLVKFIDGDRLGEIAKKLHSSIKVKHGNSLKTSIAEMEIEAVFAKYGVLSARFIQRLPCFPYLKENFPKKVIETIISDLTQNILGFQERILEKSYPVVFFHELSIEIHSERNSMVYMAIGLKQNGIKEVIGIHVHQDREKGPRELIKKIAEYGVEDIFVAICNSNVNTEYQNSIKLRFPKANVHEGVYDRIKATCSGLNYRQQKEKIPRFNEIYKQENIDAARHFFDELQKENWAKKIPSVFVMWKQQWQQIEEIYTYPLGVRRAMTTVDCIDRLCARYKKEIRGRLFDQETAEKSLSWFAWAMTRSWRRAPSYWGVAKRDFASYFGTRFLEINPSSTRPRLSCWRHA